MNESNGANGTDPDVREVAFPADLLRKAAEFRWANPDATWQEVAEHVGRTRRQVERWRQSEEWEAHFQNAGAAYVEKLAPAAVHALVKAWAKGNAQGAIDVLRSFGFLRPDRLEIAAEIGAAEGALIAEIIKAVIFQIDVGLTPEQQERLVLGIAERLPS